MSVSGSLKGIHKGSIRGSVGFRVWSLGFRVCRLRSGFPGFLSVWGFGVLGVPGFKRGLGLKVVLV